MHLDLNRLKENSHMILIEFIGLDQYLVGDLSKILTRPLANVFETSPDEINFYAPNAQIYHEGIEQTSWYSVVRVFLPEKYHPFEEQAAKILIEEDLYHSHYQKLFYRLIFLSHRFQLDIFLNRFYK